MDIQLFPDQRGMPLIESLRRWGTTLLDYLDRRRKRWIEKHKVLLCYLKRVYILFLWILLPLAVLAWILLPSAREALVQFLWSYYLLWQFWFLARSKTLTWTGTARLFAVGAWIIAPLSALSIYSFHGLFADGTATVRADWSINLLGPVVEEALKLLPFFLLFLFTRRTRTFSLTDYMLAGAAVGVGFDFMEEMVRRWVTSGREDSLLGILSQLLSDTEQSWEIFTLFPGSFSDGEAISVGHGVWTGFITLGIGLAVMMRRHWGNKTALLPAFLFAWAFFDHAAWNAHDDPMPFAFDLLYTLTGHGHFFKWIFVAALVLALWLDYRELNRVRDRLPLLLQETVLEPVTEFLLPVQSIFRGRQAWGHSLNFLRERRLFGFSLLRPLPDNSEMSQTPPELNRRWQFLSGIFATLLCLVLLQSIAEIGLENPDAYFTGLLNRLSDWWQGLNGWEKAGVLITVAALGAFLTAATGGGWIAGGFTALGTALTAKDILEDPEPTKAFLEDPWGKTKAWAKELLQRPPQEALIATTVFAADRILGRIPVVKVVDELAHLIKKRTQHLGRRWFGGRPYSEAQTGMRMDVHGPDVRETRGSGGAGGTGGGSGESPRNTYRNDDDFHKETRPSQSGKSEIPKAYLDSNGSLQPANPDGKTTITEHVLNVKKENSPYISTTPNEENLKLYGGQQIKIDLEGLQSAIDKGEVNAQIFHQDQIVDEIKSVLNEKARTLNELQSKQGVSQKRINKLVDKIEYLQAAIENTQRDQEILIKGTIPKEFIEGPYNLKGDR